MVKEGKLIIIVAPSGVGKSTLIRKIKENFPCLEESISYTTRPARQGESNGAHYHFIGIEEFNKKKDAGDFLEWAQVHRNFYGTSKTFVENKIKEGVNLIFDLDVQGADAMKKYFKNKAQAIFIAPPSIEELEKRLIGRGTDTAATIQVRIGNARREVLKKEEYDFLVFNDNLDDAYNELKKIIHNILEA